MTLLSLKGAAAYNLLEENETGEKSPSGKIFA